MDPELRPVYHATQTPGRVSVVYSSRAPDKYLTLLSWCGLLRCCSCDCSTFNSRKRTLQNTAVIVYENKIKYNNPWTFGTLGGDNITTVYLDDPRFDQFEPAGFCSPFCTHNLCCPTYGGTCGQGIVIYKRVGWNERCCGSGACCSGCCGGCNCNKCEDPPNYSSLGGSFPTNIAQQAGVTVNQFCFRGCAQDFILLYPVADASELIKALKQQRTFVKDFIQARKEGAFPANENTMLR
jgi:hypothetical protein